MRGGLLPTFDDLSLTRWPLHLPKGMRQMLMDNPKMFSHCVTAVGAPQSVGGPSAD